MQQLYRQTRLKNDLFGKIIYGKFFLILDQPTFNRRYCNLNCAKQTKIKKNVLHLSVSDRPNLHSLFFCPNSNKRIHALCKQCLWQSVSGTHVMIHLAENFRRVFIVFFFLVDNRAHIPYIITQCFIYAHVLWFLWTLTVRIWLII